MFSSSTQVHSGHFIDQTNPSNSFHHSFLSLKGMICQNNNQEGIDPLIRSILDKARTIKELNQGTLLESRNRICLKVDKELLDCIFLLIGKEEKQVEPNILIEFIQFMIFNNSNFNFGLSYYDLTNSIENWIRNGEFTSEIFRSLSFIFHILPDVIIKRLSGDFFEHMSSLLEMFQEPETLSSSASIFLDILAFLQSTKSSVWFQEQLFQREIHLKLCKCLIELDISSLNHLLNKNQNAVLEVIMNCLLLSGKFVDQVFSETIPYELRFFKEKLINMFVGTNFDLSIQSEELMQNAQEIFHSIEAYEQFKKSINKYYSNSFDLHWKKFNVNFIPFENIQQAESVLFEFSFKINNSPSKIIAFITTGFEKVNDFQITTPFRNYLFWYDQHELRLLSDKISFKISGLNQKLVIHLENKAIFSFSYERISIENSLFDLLKPKYPEMMSIYGNIPIYQSDTDFSMRTYLGHKTLNFNNLKGLIGLISKQMNAVNLQNVFPILLKIASSNQNSSFLEKYHFLSEKFSHLTSTLQYLLGEKCYVMLFWFILSRNHIRDDLKTLFQTILHCLLEKDLAYYEPNDIFKILKESLMAIQNEIDQSDFKDTMNNLNECFKVGLLQEENVLRLFIEAILWKGDVLKENNQELKLPMSCYE